MRISDLARRSGVPTPTIKHYIREGLLPAPHARTSRNMAYYDARLAERVRTIKALQGELFLPLKVIGEMLEPAPSAALREDAERPQARPLSTLGPAARAGALEARRRRGAAAEPRRRAEVLASGALTAGELDRLAALGVVQPVVDDRGEPVYGGTDLDLLDVIAETRRKGLGEAFSLDIVAPYVAAVRQLVRFEIALFRQRVLAGARLPVGPEMSLDAVAREATALGERLLVALRARLVVEELAGAPTPDGSA